jgi:MFS family permease
MHPHHHHHHYTTTSAAEDDASDDDEDSQQGRGQQCLSCAGLLALLLFLGCTFFTILLIYALCTNNTESVRNACPDLYPYMVARAALGLCVFLGMCVLSSSFNRRSTRRTYFFLIYFMALAIWGGVVVTRSMLDNARCTDALFDSFFQGPLLGILGWVCFALDLLYTLGLLLSVAQLRQEPQPQL